jgi:Glyoxalase-like domain
VAQDCERVLAVLAGGVDVASDVEPVLGDVVASIGGSDGERREPAWYFNKVPEPKQAKNRVHIDLVNPDPDAVSELVRLGATVIGEHQIPGQRWTVMQDPEGNEMCIAAKSFTGFD